MSAPSRLKRESSLGEEVAQRPEGPPSDAPSRPKRESSLGEEVAQRPEGPPSAAPSRLKRESSPGEEAAAPHAGLRVARDGKVTELTLDRPRQRNSLSASLVAGLAQALADCASDGTRLVVLRGAPEAFCSGFDLGGLASETDDTLLARFVRVEQLLQQLVVAPFTTVAYAEGPAMGAGADLFAACDYRYAADGTRFAFPGAGFGLVLGSRRLALQVGGDTAQRWITSGERLDVDEAASAGLVTARLALDAWPDCLARHRRQASRLDDDTHARIARATRLGAEPAALDSDLAALVASAARPGLKARIEAYVQAGRQTAGPRG
ncbi:MAG: enoyl-CoA hydratase/isomerase family protein [Pigmentiphaga sp.]|nr:enoyl-CoA hydratase/isomerase family protein [Pigmentiphaga sp.]